MKGMSFLKKEITETARTSKMLVLFVLFLFFGIVGPLTARYVNEIMAAVGGLEGIIFPEPTWKDAWVQFFNNYETICIFALLLMFMGTIVNEKKSGTLILMTSKGLNKSTFVLTKYLSSVLYYTVAYILYAGMTIVYTLLMFSDFNTHNLMLPLIIYWLSGLFYLAMTILFSVLASNITSAAIMSIGGFMLINLIGIVHFLKNYLPSNLQTVSMQLILGQNYTHDITKTILGTLLLLFICLTSAVYILKKQEL